MIQKPLITQTYDDLIRKGEEKDCTDVVQSARSENKIKIMICKVRSMTHYLEEIKPLAVVSKHFQLVPYSEKKKKNSSKML